MTDTKINISTGAREDDRAAPWLIGDQPPPASWSWSHLIVPGRTVGVGHPLATKRHQTPYSRCPYSQFASLAPIPRDQPLHVRSFIGLGPIPYSPPPGDTRRRRSRAHRPARPRAWPSAQPPSAATGRGLRVGPNLNIRDGSSTGSLYHRAHLLYMYCISFSVLH